MNATSSPVDFLTSARRYQISYSAIDKASNVSAVQNLTVTIAAPTPAHSPTIDLTSAPSSVVENTWESDTLIRLFPERQNYILPANVMIDTQGTTIAAGTKVNVFYLHADKVGTDNTQALVLSGSVAFDTPVLGVISTGAALLNSHAALGNTPTAYSSSIDQGIEWGDSVTLTGDKQLNLSFSLWNMTDDVRVITLAE